MIDSAVEAALHQYLGSIPKVAEITSVGGSSINRCYELRLASGQHLFCKTYARLSDFTSTAPGMYVAEKYALEKIAETNTIRVPKPLFANEGCLILEFFETYSDSRSAREDTYLDSQEVLGRQLAALHRSTKQPDYGFERDNYIGSTPQVNTWQDDWISFCAIVD